MSTIARTEPLPLTQSRIIMLALFGAATILLIPMPDELAKLGKVPLGIGVALGILAWLGSAFLVMKDESAELKRRLSVLLGCIGLLGAIDINTSLTNANFLHVGIPFFLVIFIPALIFARTDPGIIRYRFWPKKWRKLDIFYTILSIPLAWAVLKFYGWGNLALFNDELFRHWTLPPSGPEEQEAITRLFIGINLVGIWDELFFVNTVFAVLRSLFAYRISNILQAIVYTAVLYDMAFTGLGIFIVFAFAWTQGAMFEKSETLLWVLIVHLIVDYFLVAAIVSTFYDGYGLDFLLQLKFTGFQ